MIGEPGVVKSARLREFVLSKSNVTPVPEERPNSISIAVIDNGPVVGSVIYYSFIFYTYKYTMPAPPAAPKPLLVPELEFPAPPPPPPPPEPAAPACPL